MNLSFIPPALLPRDVITLTTPINASDGFTFGFSRKNVSAVCVTSTDITANWVWDANADANVRANLLWQISIASSLIAACKFLLKPFLQASIVSQIMGGLLGGPSGLGLNTKFLMMTFPFKSLYLLNTIASFACLLFVFIAGVKTDISLVKRAGKTEWMIGVLAYMFPMLACTSASLIVDHYDVDLDEKLKNVIQHLPFLIASSTYHSIAIFLDDLKLLNSELGRIALSSSIITTALSYVSLVVKFIKSTSNTHHSLGVGGIFSLIALVLLIFFPLRYLLNWMVKQTQPGERVRELYLGFTLLLVFGCAFAGELIGVHAFLGPSILGLVLPAGSALAATIVRTGEVYVAYVILPLYFLSCGLSTSLTLIDSRAYFALEFLWLLGFSAKFVGLTLVSVFLCGFVPKDAVSLAFILSTIGVLDIRHYHRALQLELIDYRCFGVLITSGMLITGVGSYFVETLYNPFQRYSTGREKRTIQHLPNNAEFPILVCIHSEEYVPNIINLLEACNPTRESRICIYLLHLVELLGGATPMVLHHSLETLNFHQKHPHHYEPIKSVINAFRVFQRNNDSIVTLQAFTAISPRSTMHNDVCMLSLDNEARLIIIPFHKKWNSSGLETDTPEVRMVNLAVIEKAPCSVGILIDRGSSNEGLTTSLRGSFSLYRVGVLFIGGCDDREAVSYATRMLKHPNITVTLIRLVAFSELEVPTTDHDDFQEKRLDNAIINMFRQTNILSKEKAVYKEEILVDSAGITFFIRSMENDFDLILVGRRTESPLMVGLSEWKEYPELGLMGDLLASKDFQGKVSILVIQQHRVEKV